MKVKTPRLVIAGLSGDAGKTIVSLSVLAALRRKRLNVAPFKKGPDYIDPAWLSTVSGNTCRNLDTYLVDSEIVLRSFVRHASTADISVIEGNRGLFDGKDLSGQHSTAGLAKLLQAPLLLVVNVTKATATVAALVKGCQVYDPELKIAGIILNKVAGARHEKIIREAVAASCGLPVIGAIPKLGDDASLLPGRHLGLVTPEEFPAREEIEVRLAQIAADYLDIDHILRIAEEVPELNAGGIAPQETVPAQVRIGYFKDSVFTFYYPENLEALRQCGAELVPVSSLADSSLPEINALYIGGGFPETHADRLVENRSLMESVKTAAENGLPIYAECGGLIYLCRSLKCNSTLYPMAGVFPVDLEMRAKPVGHGYARLQIDRNNPFFIRDKVINGHEFHYSEVVSEIPEEWSCMSVRTGVGLGGGRDGLLANRTLACYTHIHADSVRDWAAAMIAAAKRPGANAPCLSSGGCDHPQVCRVEPI